MSSADKRTWSRYGPRERVHADTPIGQITRDDVAGKYYMRVDGRRVTRLPFRLAVEYATMDGATVRYGALGGSAFDRAVRERLSA